MNLHAYSECRIRMDRLSSASYSLRHERHVRNIKRNCTLIEEFRVLEISQGNEQSASVMYLDSRSSSRT